MIFAPKVQVRALHRPLWQLILNSTLCIAWVYLSFAYIRKNIYLYPITVEAIWQICLGEANRRKNKRRVRQLRRDHDRLDTDDLEKKPSQVISNFSCLASVVGYREDPALFRKCLESYRGCPGVETLLIGIDGNQAQDIEMANVVASVYPETTFINLDEPPADLVVRLAEEHVFRELKEIGEQELSEDWSWSDIPDQMRRNAGTFAMDQVYARITDTLQAHDLLYPTPGAFNVICISQPHVNKKGILFTNVVVSVMLGRFNHIPYLWTSDSDTWILPDTIPHVVGCMANDPKVGGSCSLLGIHNAHDSYVSLLGSAIYWSELAITRGQTGAIDAADCQPGPCAAFLLDALSPNLFGWYTQTCMGVKTIVNEDRHLTTKLLLDGWKVTFNTEAIAYTDCPTTLLRMLLQQIRWGRATQIETFWYPAAYAIHGPIFFIVAFNRVYGPLAVLVLTLRYVFTGHVVRPYSVYDVLARMILVTAYNLLCYKKQAGCSLPLLAISQFIYQIPLPGLIVYATVTALEGGWGTSMRNQREVQKSKGTNWQHLRAITAVAVWLGIVAAALARIFSSSYAPEMLQPLMLGSATCAVVASYYLLLRSERV